MMISATTHIVKRIDELLAKSRTVEENLELGWLHYQIRYTSLAIMYYQEAKESGCNYPSLHFYLGQAEETAKNYDQALRAYSDAIAKDPNYLDALYARAELCSGMKLFEAALRDFNKVIELNPRNAIAYSRRGDIHGTLGNYHKGLDDYNTAINIAPSNHWLYHNRAVFQLKNNRWEQAIQDARTAANMAPSEKAHRELLEGLTRNNVITGVRPIISTTIMSNWIQPLPHRQSLPISPSPSFPHVIVSAQQHLTSASSPGRVYIPRLQAAPAPSAATSNRDENQSPPDGNRRGHKRQRQEEQTIRTDTRRHQYTITPEQSRNTLFAIPAATSVAHPGVVIPIAQRPGPPDVMVVNALTSSSQSVSTQSTVLVKEEPQENETQDQSCGNNKLAL